MEATAKTANQPQAATGMSESVVSELQQRILTSLFSRGHEHL
jgi:hypothetical protein